MMNPTEREPMSNLIEASQLRKRNTYRSTLSQVLVTLAQSLLLLDLGMMIAVPTVLIGFLHNAKDGLSLDDSQSSWFGSIMLLCQPLGSVLSGYAQGVLGRKKSMLIVNIPHLAAWYMLYSARDVRTLYAASFVMGIGMGFLEAPTLSYIGEISEPRIRGILATYTNSNVVIGHLVEFIFGYFFSWRRAMLISCLIPIFSILAILLIPESPIWLLTRGRKEEAMVSLRWLRGWVSADDVRAEFDKMEMDCIASKNEYTQFWESRIKKSTGFIGVPNDEFVVKTKPGFIDALRDLLRPAILKPIRLVVTYFFFYHCASLTAMRPYMIEVFLRMKVPLSSYVLTVISAVLQCSGAFVCFCLVHLIGKRALSLISMTGCTACCLLMGISPIPWLLISEVFPTRGRGVASGISAASFYVIAFFVSKTWLNLEHLIGLHGCLAVYGVLASFGIVFIYFCLPETENKTLAEIETYFNSKSSNK
ncbi:facilitated trehalose transporter Tret1-like isoform X2 [Adelges cooleyi]|uniref:facilitated trehalose transporter Tret1-like isoform X2 n=1 Tax=Adelges cooleyi TaxID=133065 RepID=UPI0021804BAD|nr:facilitated trehalose transporter Tret1-like isoform X2 [Adelges cooleyi]